MQERSCGLDVSHTYFQCPTHDGVKPLTSPLSVGCQPYLTGAGLQSYDLGVVGHISCHGPLRQGVPVVQVPRPVSSGSPWSLQESSTGRESPRSKTVVSGIVGNGDVKSEVLFRFVFFRLSLWIIVFLSP